MRPRIVEAVYRFAGRGENPRAVDPQPLLCRKQPKLDGVPIKPRQVTQMAEAQRLQPALAVGLHVIGENRVHQHRHMAVDVVEDVRLLQVVELVAMPDETGRGEAPAGEKRKKHVVGNQPRHRDDAPPGHPVEDVAEAAEIGNPACGNPKALQPIEIFPTGAARQQALLALEQQAPDRVLVLAVIPPVLLDEVILDPAHRALRAVALTPPCTYERRRGASIAASPSLRAKRSNPEPAIPIIRRRRAAARPGTPA